MTVSGWAVYLSHANVWSTNGASMEKWQNPRCLEVGYSGRKFDLCTGS